MTRCRRTASNHLGTPGQTAGPPPGRGDSNNPQERKEPKWKTGENTNGPFCRDAGGQQGCGRCPRSLITRATWPRGLRGRGMQAAGVWEVQCGLQHAVWPRCRGPTLSPPKEHLQAAHLKQAPRLPQRKACTSVFEMTRAPVPGKGKASSGRETGHREQGAADRRSAGQRRGHSPGLVGTACASSCQAAAAQTRVENPSAPAWAW